MDKLPFPTKFILESDMEKETDQKSSKVVDALLLCGDRGASRSIRGESKAFLTIKGEPLFIHMLKALDGAALVQRIFVIGEKQRIDNSIKEFYRDTKSVITLEQWGHLVDNVWNGFLATIDGYKDGAEKDPDIGNRVVLALPCDAPLISCEEIDDFISRADMDKYDYVVGLTPKESLEKYYSTEQKPGIKMAYMHFREGLLRINNLHMARPFAFKNRTVIQQLYEARYQKKFHNFAKLLKDAWGIPGVPSKAWLYFTLHVSLALTRLGFEGASDMTRHITPMDSVIDGTGEVLGVRAGYLLTTDGGAALDIDNERDFVAMEQMFDEWKAFRSSSNEGRQPCKA